MCSAKEKIEQHDPSKNMEVNSIAQQRKRLSNTILAKTWKLTHVLSKGKE